MKKVLSIVLSIAMVVCLAPTMAFAATTNAAQSNAAYSDIEGTACEGAVNVLSALKVVDGFTDGTYKPEQTVTRAQMAKLIVTALGVADYATAKTSKYTDMGAATWAIPYVEYASNLNIVNGVGNNKFNPNGLVTYEQAATMIVRALGFTDECNEMNGTWPAIYIQKATALGIFQDVQNGGAKSANRGDTAIMLYNALDVAEVYADKDGQTQYKKGYNGSSYLTMMDTLNKNGQSYYKVIESGDVDDALTNIAEYLGANAKVTEDENGNVLAVGDIKSTFLKGDISDDGKNIKVGDTNYSLTSAKYQIVNRETGAGENFTTSNSAVVLNINGETKTSGISEITSASAIKFGDKNVTIAAKVSGTTVKEIYSVSAWNSTNDSKVDESDIAQITSNKKLLGQKFIKDDEQKIDTTSFILNGVSSLDEIKADNVVYVYSNTNGEIKRVDVGTKTVTGTITKIDGSNIYIDGTKYKKASSKLNADFTDLTTAGDEVTVDLDYDGKIYKGEIKDSSTGTYAVVVDMSSTLNSGAISSASKIQLLTADGVKVFNVNGTKYSNNVTDHKGSAWGTTVTTGAIVKYTLNSSNEITKVIALNDTITPAAAKYTVVGPDTKTVNKSGYIDSKKIADNVTVFSVPTKNGAFDYSDDDDLGTTTRATILDSTLNLATYVVDKDNNKVVAMIVSDDSSSDDQYGIATSTYDLADNNTGVDLYVGTEKVADQTLSDASDGVTPVIMAKKSGNTAAVTTTNLYKVQKTAANEYKFKAVTKNGDGTNPITTNGAITFKNGYAVVQGNSYGMVEGNALTVYIYDESDDAFSIGTKADMLDDDVVSMTLYSTDKSTDDNYQLINYVVIYRH